VVQTGSGQAWVDKIVGCTGSVDENVDIGGWFPLDGAPHSSEPTQQAA